MRHRNDCKIMIAKWKLIFKHITSYQKKNEQTADKTLVRLKFKIANNYNDEFQCKTIMAHVSCTSETRTYYAFNWLCGFCCFRICLAYLNIIYVNYS